MSFRGSGWLLSPLCKVKLAVYFCSRRLCKAKLAVFEQKRHVQYSGMIDINLNVCKAFTKLLNFYLLSKCDCCSHTWGAVKDWIESERTGWCKYLEWHCKDFSCASIKIQYRPKPCRKTYMSLPLPCVNVRRITKSNKAISGTSIQLHMAIQSLTGRLIARWAMWISTYLQRHWVVENLSKWSMWH